MDNNKEKILEWLKTDDPSFWIEKSGHNYNFIRLSREPEIDALFSYNAHECKKIGLSSCFIYSGVYNKLDGKIYDARGELREYFDRDEKMNREAVCENFENAVIAEIEKHIGNNINNVCTILDISDYKAELEKTEYDNIERSARKFYLNDIKEVNYECDYSIYHLDDNNFTRALTDKENFAKEFAGKYIESNNDTIVKDLIINDIVREKLVEYYEKPDRSLYNLKQIIKCVSDCEQKTVNVTTSIDNKILTFKIEPKVLKFDCYFGYYNKNDIPSRSKSQFDKFYGEHIYFTPDDIIEISSNKKILYEKDNNIEIEQEITDSEGDFSMGLT